MITGEVRAEEKTLHNKPLRLYKIAGIASLSAMAANILDIALATGETEVVPSGTKAAAEWFMLFQDDWFKGIYYLGILNIVYMLCMIPLYFGLYSVHRRRNGLSAALALTIAFMGMAIYISNNAAIPMLALSQKYAAASTEAQRLLLASAGEALLMRGEDFTPGSFIGLFLTGLGAVSISAVMLRGKIFGKAVSWIGVIGFSFLSIFTVLSTFFHELFFLSFYMFGMLGGLFALSWFLLVAVKFFKLG